jgi:hypothetical protein
MSFPLARRIAVSYSPPPASSLPVAPLHAPRLWWPQRVALVMVGGLLVALLATAACLTPSARGMGTHQQLGLPPCTLVQLFGVRCPSCGMTTSWAHLMRGNVVAAFGANAGGALLGLASVLCGPWLVASGLRGRWWLTAPHEIVTLAVGLTILGVTIVDWSLRLSMGW